MCTTQKFWGKKDKIHKNATHWPRRGVLQASCCQFSYRNRVCVNYVFSSQWMFHPPPFFQCFAKGEKKKLFVHTHTNRGRKKHTHCMRRWVSVISRASIKKERKKKMEVTWPLATTNRDSRQQRHLGGRGSNVRLSRRRRWLPPQKVEVLYCV